MNQSLYTSKPSGGNANQNSIPNANFTAAELRDFIEGSPENAISFAIMRNPTKVYEYLRLNYGDEYPLLKQGAAAALPQMDTMSTFLMRQYNNLPENKRRHFLATILHSLPAQAELQNWTTPQNAQ